MLSRFIPDAGERQRFRRWALVALALHVAAGVFSSGWMAADEHWQVIEFASAVLGRTSTADLPWEYAARERQALQPVLSAAIEWPLIHAGIDDPFVLAGVLRVVGALVAWAAAMLMGLVCLSWFRASPVRRWVAPALALTWFLPYVHARTSSENASEAAFLFGFAWLIRLVGSTEREAGSVLALPTRAALGIGALFGLAFELRFQVGIMVACALGWCLVFARPRVSALFALVAGLGALVALGVVADRFFYGVWTFVPWTYFQTQVLHHQAAAFSTAPWWTYFPLVLEKVGPPLSVVLLAGVLAGWIARPRSLITWTMAPFVAVHVVMAHKELRLLDPLATLAVLLTLRSIDDARQRWPRLAASRWTRALAGLLIAQDVAMLAVGTFTPAKAAMPILREIRSRVRPPAVLYWRGTENPYAEGVGLLMRFYEPPGVTLASVPDYAALERSLGAGDTWYVERRSQLPPGAGALVDECRVEATTLPGWVRLFDVNGWVERTPAWTLYRCHRVDLDARHR